MLSDRMVCSVCGGVTFDSREEQTQHYKSDWHRFNLKQRIKGSSPMSIESFEEAVAGTYSLRTSPITVECLIFARTLLREFREASSIRQNKTRQI